jgi:hypothetical protein
MDLDAPRRHERALGQEQQDPAGGYRGVQVHQRRERRSVAEASEIVRRREPDEDQRGAHRGHRGEEAVVPGALVGGEAKADDGLANRVGLDPHLPLLW